MIKNDLISFLEDNSYRDKRGRKLFHSKIIYDNILYQELLKFLSGIPMVTKLTPRELLWCLKNNYNTEPRCKTCKRPLDFKIETSNKNLTKDYVRKYCNLKCFNNNPEVKAEAVRREKEMAPQRLLEKEARMKEAGLTWKDMPGIDNFNKTRERMLVDPEFIKQRSENTRKTNRIRYGVDHLNQLLGEGKRRRKIADKTCLIKFGVKNPFSCTLLQTAIKTTNLIKYGFEIATLNREIALKIMPKYYNLENYIKLSKKYIEDHFIDDSGFLKHSEFITFLNCSITVPYKMCHKFGVTFKYKQGSSRAEEELAKFITSLIEGVKIDRNIQTIIKPKELDIYLSDFNLAIEYNGLLWHSHGIDNWSAMDNPEANPNRHLNKTKTCQEKNIDLIHIFEEEYIKNKQFYQDLIAWKLRMKEPPEFNDEKVRWNLNWGKPPEQLQNDYVVVEILPPRMNYFKINKFLEVSQWTQYKTEEELYQAGYRKYYDTGELLFRKKLN